MKTSEKHKLYLGHGQVRRLVHPGRPQPLDGHRRATRSVQLVRVEQQAAQGHGRSDPDRKDGVDVIFSGGDRGRVV